MAKATRKPQGTLNPDVHMDIESIRPILEELERAADWFTNRYRLEELQGQKHTIVLYTGSKPSKCYGWFKGHQAEVDTSGKATGNLLYPWYTKEGAGVTEIMLTGERLNRDVMSILTTLFHEQIHALALARGIQDVAKSGRHNKRYAELADTCDLKVEEDDKGSHTLTSMMPSLLKAVESDLKPNADVFRLAAGKFQPKPKMENKRMKFVCQCETGIQRKGAEYRSVMAAYELHATCNDCHSEFQRAES